jgi:hypothetical protein
MLGIGIAVMAFGLGTPVITGSAAVATDTAYYHLYDQTSGKCLDNWSSHTAGTQVRQYNCWNGAQQMWRTIYTYGSVGVWDVIQNEFSGQCMWVSGSHTTTNGESVIQYPCNYNFTSTASMGENWYATFADTGTATFVMSAVCAVSSCTSGGYGSPTHYDLTETTKTNGAIATIYYAADQSIQGLIN